MKEAIVYGGAFNPPTRAHQAILQACVERAEQNNGEVWLIPSGDRRDKTIESNRARRLELLEALVESVHIRVDGAVKIHTLELDATELTETYETHNQLQRAYPECDIKWVFGSDSVATMETWKNGLWMYKNLGMLVIQRPGYELGEFPPRADSLTINVPAMSSTEVRRKIAAGEPIDHLVPTKVAGVLEYAV